MGIAQREGDGVRFMSVWCKDAANKKSNQKNLGTIKSSNLCAEVNLYSDDKETAVCNLASINLKKYLN